MAQWVPTWLLFGVYNKLVKLEGHDKLDRGEEHERPRRHVQSGSPG